MMLFIFSSKVAADYAGFRGHGKHRQDGNLVAWWPGSGCDVLRGHTYSHVIVTDGAFRAHRHGTREFAELCQGVDLAKAMLSADPKVYIAL
jgi:hypothetical protein